MRVASIVCAMILGGCSLAQQAEHNRRVTVMTAAGQECAARYPMPRTGQWRDWAACVNQAEAQIFRGNVPYPDLFEQMIAARLAYAAKIDRGEISAEDGMLAMSRTYADLTSEKERRSAMRQSAIAQDRAARAAVISAIQAPATPAPVRMQTRCTTWKDTTTCD